MSEAGPAERRSLGEEAPGDGSRPATHLTVRPAVWMMIIWFVGAVLLWSVVALRTQLLRRDVERMPAIDEGPLRVQLERIAHQLEIAHVPDLRIAEAAGSPYLIGLWNPTIVLPRSLIADLSESEMRTILLHELLHWRRRDTWVGCFQVFVQGLFWFHPLVWWASAQLRSERENVVDAEVLHHGEIPAEAYGETLLRVLTSTRARSHATGTLVGVFERGARLQQRLENVMSYQTANQSFGRLSWAFLAAFALLFVPMGNRERPDAVVADDRSDTPAPDAQKTRYPVIIRTSPEMGAVDVPTSLSEISVTFDRDMAGGMSWTGGPPLFPTIDESRKPKWSDKRTCVLPVTLERATFYRLGINSKSHQNFKSESGVPTPPVAIFFVTEGASEEVQARVQVPAVVKLLPANRADAVPASTDALRVTFNMPMGEGMSWTGGGENFPQPTGEAIWSEDRKTCTLPVQLKPDHSYQLGLNSLSHNNFQSKWGVPLEPVVYEFTTAAP
jgi:beta-lactamase regulating signal transducer with metallopeptidase domain